MTGCYAPQISFSQMQSVDEIADCVRQLKTEFSHLEERVNLAKWCLKLQCHAYNVAIFANRKIVGFAAVYINDFLQKEAYLTLIGIDANHRRHGYGRLLLEHCIGIAEKKGMQSIRLEVDGDNVVGQAFYRSMGFQQDSITERGSFMMKKQIYNIRHGGGRCCINGY